METDWEPLRNLPKGPAHLVHSQNLEPRFQVQVYHQTTPHISEVPENRGTWGKICTCHKFSWSSDSDIYTTHTHTHYRPIWAWKVSHPSQWTAHQAGCPGQCPTFWFWPLESFWIWDSSHKSSTWLCWPESCIYLPTEPSHHLHHYLIDQMHTPLVLLLANIYWMLTVSWALY